MVLTGAGVNAESGLGTYCDNGGLWDNYGPMEVASIDGWYRNRGKVLDFYNMQRQKLKTAMPNGAHQDIAALKECFDISIDEGRITHIRKTATEGMKEILSLL